jgi:hypothetical protein
VSVTVRTDPDGDPHDVKALLHWDRVGLFGGNWPSPKNSPMHLLRENGQEATFGVTLGSLPPGKYEYAAHVLGANDIWVRLGEFPTESNGRIEVLPSRAPVVDKDEVDDLENRSRKEDELQTQLAGR